MRGRLPARVGRLGMGALSAWSVALLAVLGAGLSCDDRAPGAAQDLVPGASQELARDSPTLAEPDLTSLESIVRAELIEARAELERRAAQSGQSNVVLAEGYGDLGRLYLAHSLLEPAAACFEAAGGLTPEQFQWPYYLGRVWLRLNDRSAAQVAFERALTLRPEDVPTLIALGALALERSEAAPAEGYFARALEANPTSAAANAGLGRVAASRGAFEPAAGYFETALRLQPSATAVHYELGMIHRELGDLEQAGRHLALRGERRAGEPDPLMDQVAALATGARAHLLRAGRALGAGRLDEGTAELRRAIDLDPNDATARVTLGAVLAQSDDAAGAREQFEEALRLEPDNAKGHYNLGILSAEEGADREAVEHFRTALTSEPEHGRAELQLGSALSRLGLDGEAVEHLARASRLLPADETVCLREVAALVRLARFGAARDRVEQGRVVLPESARIKHALARLLAASPEEEVRDGTAALALATEVASDAGLLEGRIDFDHGQTLAMAYAEIGQFDRAVALQEALVAAAERDRQFERVPQLRRNLDSYRNGTPCRVPWPADDPFLGPPSVTRAAAD